MRKSEIKKLFMEAERQVYIDENQKQKTCHEMIKELKKQKSPVMSVRGILYHQILYMDKVFFAIYGAVICLGIIFISVLHYTGVNQNEMIKICMAGAALLSIMSICTIDKLFFGGMGELGESCYFNTKQCVAAWLVLSGMINAVVLISGAGYLNYCWKLGLLQVVLYILTPYQVSNVIALRILSIENRGKRSALFGTSVLFLPIGFAIVGSTSGVFLTTAIGVWVATFFLSVFLFAVQMKKLLNKMEKGDVLCMS